MAEGAGNRADPSADRIANRPDHSWDADTRSAWWIAKCLNLEYSHAKRAVRSLVAWKVLQRSPAGLVFQPDYRLWQRPAS